MISSREWKRGRSKEITFIVTKDCQLACKYCYQVGKNNSERLTWETAKKGVDFILSQDAEEWLNIDSVIFSFIGGEPFLEIELIDRICDYLKIQMYQKGHHWFNSYRFAITTNGINYDNPKVQRFVQKNLKHLSITITIDGTQKKHDLNRVWKPSKNGDMTNRGSYENVVKNIPLWLSQFPNAATKVTISSADIPYICESVLHLYSLGIHIVYINCVFENVWHEGDDILFEKQLKKLADYIVENHMYKNYSCSFFQRWIGKPLDANRDENWCGAGLMLAIDKSGVLYPCIRMAKYSLRDKQARTVGSLEQGLDKNLIRPYYYLSRSIQSTKECFECNVASGCAWCQAENYDCSDDATIFSRSTAICKMHKARVRANDYYWAKIDDANEAQIIGESKPVNNKCTLDKNIESPDTVNVLLSTNSTPFCITDNPKQEESLIPLHILEKFINDAKRKGLKVNFVMPKRRLPQNYYTLMQTIPHKIIAPIESKTDADAIIVNKWSDILSEKRHSLFYILRTTLMEFCRNTIKFGKMLENSARLNFVFTDEAFFSTKNEQPYSQALDILVQQVLRNWEKGHFVKVNLITDRLEMVEMDNCNAGWKSVTLAANGKYYICPDYYFEDETNSCGDINRGLNIKNPLLYKLNHAPICRDCGAYHCQRCVFLNKKKTLEVNIPSYEQCTKSEIELVATKKIYELWKEHIHL